MGPKPLPGKKIELINAGKEYVTLLQGRLLFPPGDSFAMMRGSHLDISACWGLSGFRQRRPRQLEHRCAGCDPGRWRGDGSGHRRPPVFVMMDHLTRDGECKLVAQCSCPLTGVGCVSRIYTDTAVIDITDRGPVVREIFNGLSFEELQRIAPVALTFEQLAESVRNL